ncbi:hypothetical protein SDC9_132258 [bioreactor metagenome]|uniref:Uncharacterized protein n=1 Tax=bioreactor metagenome TaxID=1076179 RepID=A0A645D6N3_9ZZZZ
MRAAFMRRMAKTALTGHTHVNAVRLPHLPEPDHVNVDPDDLNYDEEPI